MIAETLSVNGATSVIETLCAAQCKCLGLCVSSCRSGALKFHGFDGARIKKRCAKLMVSADDISSDVPEEAAVDGKDEAYDPLADISDRDLRQIFSALVDAL